MLSSWIAVFFFLSSLCFCFAHEFITPTETSVWYTNVPYRLDFNPPIPPDLLEVSSLRVNYQAYLNVLWNQSANAIEFRWNQPPPVLETSFYPLQLTLYQHDQKVFSSPQFLLQDFQPVELLPPTAGSTPHHLQVNTSKTSFFVFSSLSFIARSTFSKVVFYLYDWQLDRFVYSLGSSSNQTDSFVVQYPYHLFNLCQLNYNYSIVSFYELDPTEVLVELLTPTSLSFFSPYKWSFRCLPDIVLNSLVYTFLLSLSASNVYAGTNLTFRWTPDVSTPLNLTLKLVPIQQTGASKVVVSSIPSSQRSVSFLWPFHAEWCNKQQLFVVETPDVFSGETKFFSFSTLTTRCFNESLQSMVVVTPCAGCSYTVGSTLPLTVFNGPFQRQLQYKLLPSNTELVLSNASNTLLTQLAQSWSIPVTFECGQTNTLQVRDVLTQDVWDFPQKFFIPCRTTFFGDLRVISPTQGQTFGNGVFFRTNWTSSIPNQWVGLFLVNAHSEYFLQRVYVTSSDLQTFSWRIPIDFPCDDSEWFQVSVRYWNTGFSDGQSEPFRILCLEKNRFVYQALSQKWPPQLNQEIIIEWVSGVADVSVQQDLLLTQGLPADMSVQMNVALWSWNNQSNSLGSFVTQVGIVDLSQLYLVWQVTPSLSCQTWFVFRLFDQTTWWNQVDLSAPFQFTCDESLVNTMNVHVKPSTLYFHDPLVDVLSLNVSWSGSVQGRQVRIDLIRTTTSAADLTSRLILPLAKNVDSTALLWTWSNLSVVQFPFLCQGSYQFRISYQSSSTLREGVFPLGPGTGNGSFARSAAGWSLSSVLSVLCRTEQNNDPSILVTAPTNNSLFFPATTYTLAWTGGLLNRPLSIGLFNLATNSFMYWIAYVHLNLLNNQSLTFTFPTDSQIQLDGCNQRFQFVYRYADSDNPLELMFTTNIYDFACSKIEIVRPFFQERVYPGSTFNLTWMYGLPGRRLSVFFRSATRLNQTYLLSTVTTSSGALLSPWVRTSQAVLRLPENTPCNDSYELIVQGNDGWMISASSFVFQVVCPLIPTIQLSGNALISVSYVTSFQLHILTPLLTTTSSSSSSSIRNIFCRGSNLGCLNVWIQNSTHYRLQWVHASVANTGFSCTTSVLSVWQQMKQTWTVVVSPRAISWINGTESQGTPDVVCVSHQPLSWFRRNVTQQDVQLDTSNALANLVTWTDWSLRLINCETDPLVSQRLALGLSVCETDPTLSLNIPSSSSFLMGTSVNLSWSVSGGESLFLGRRVSLQLQSLSVATTTFQTKPLWESGWVDATLLSFPFQVPNVASVGCDQAWWIRIRLEGAFSSGWSYSSVFSISCFQTQVSIFSPALNVVLKTGSQNRYTLSWRDDSLLSSVTFPNALIVPEGSVAINTFLNFILANQTSKLLLTGVMNPSQPIQSLTFSLPALYTVPCGQKQQIAIIRGNRVYALGSPLFVSCATLYPLDPQENTLASNGTSILFRWKEGLAGERVDVWLREADNSSSIFWVCSMTLSTSSNVTSFVWRIPSDFPCNKAYMSVSKYTSAFFFVDREYVGARFWLSCLSNSMDTTTNSVQSFYSLETSLRLNTFNFSETIALACRGFGMDIDRSPCLFLTSNNPLGTQLMIRQKTFFSKDGGSCTSKSYLPSSGDETRVRIQVYPRLIEMYLNETLDQVCNYVSSTQPLTSSLNKTIQYDHWNTWQGRLQLTRPLVIRPLSCPTVWRQGQSQICQPIPLLSFVYPSIANDQWYAGTTKRIQWQGVSWFSPSFLLQFELVPSSALAMEWTGHIWKSNVISSQASEFIDFVVPSLDANSALCQFASAQPFHIRATHDSESNRIPLRVLSPTFFIACANTTQYFLTQPARNSILVLSTANSYTLAWSGGLEGQKLQVHLFQENDTTSSLVGSDQVFGTITNQYGFQNVTFRLNHLFWTSVATRPCGVRYKFGLYSQQRDASFKFEVFGSLFHFACSELQFLSPTQETTVFNGTSLNISWWGGPQGVTTFVSLWNETSEFFIRSVTVSRDANPLNALFATTSFVWRVPSIFPCDQNYRIRTFSNNLQYPLVDVMSPWFYLSCQPSIPSKDTASLNTSLVYYTLEFQTFFRNHSNQWRNLFCRGADDSDRVPCVFLTPVDLSARTFLHFRHRSLSDWNSGCNSIKPLSIGTWNFVRIEVGPRLIELFINGAFETSCQTASFLEWGPTFNSSTRLDSYNNWVGTVLVSNVSFSLLNQTTCKEGCLPSFNLMLNPPLLWYFGQTEWINWTYAVGYPPALLDSSFVTLELVPLNPIFLIRSLGSSWNVSRGVANVSLSLTAPEGCDSFFYLRGKASGLTEWVYSTASLFVTCESVHELTILQPANNTLLVPGSQSRYLLQWRGGGENSLLQFYLKGVSFTNASLEVWLPLTPLLLNTRKINQQMYDFMLPFRSWSYLTNYCQYTFLVVANYANRTWINGTNVSLLCNEVQLLPGAAQVNLNGILNVTWLYGQAGRPVHLQLQDQSNGNWSTLAFTTNSFRGVTSFLWRIPPTLPCNRFYRWKVQSTSIPSLFGNTIQSKLSEPPVFVKCSRALSVFVEPAYSKTLAVLPTNVTSLSVTMKGLEENTTVDIWFSNKSVITSSPLFSKEQQDVLLLSFFSSSNQIEQRTVSLSMFLNQTSRTALFCSATTIYQIWVIQRNLGQIESFPLLIPCDPILSTENVYTQPTRLDLDQDRLFFSWTTNLLQVQNLQFLLRDNQTNQIVWRKPNILISLLQWNISSAHALFSCPGGFRVEWEQSIPWGLTQSTLNGSYSILYQSLSVAKGDWFSFPCLPLRLPTTTANQSTSSSAAMFALPSLALNASILDLKQKQQIQWSGGSTSSQFNQIRIVIRAYYNHSLQSILTLQLTHEELTTRHVFWDFPSESPFGWTEFQQQLPQNMSNSEKKTYKFYLFAQYRIEQQEQSSNWSSLFVVDYSSYWSELVIESAGSDNSAAVKRAIILGVVFGALGLLLLLYALKKYKTYRFNQRNKPFRSRTPSSPAPAFQDPKQAAGVTSAKLKKKKKASSSFSPDIELTSISPISPSNKKVKKKNTQKVQPQVTIHLHETEN